MDKYWYLFEVHGRQILVRKDENDEGDPSIDLVAKIEGAEMSFALVFQDEGDRDLAFGKAKELEGAAAAFAEKLIGCNTPLEALTALQG